MGQGEALRETARKWATALVTPRALPWSISLASELGALSLSASLGAALVLTPVLNAELAPALGHASRAWLWTTWLLPAATLLLALTPAALVQLLANSRPTWPWLHRANHFLATLGYFFVFADFALYQRFGRHWEDVVVYATLPRAGAAAGDASGNAALIAVLLLWSMLGALITATLRAPLAALARRASALLRWSAAGVLGIAGVALIASLWLVVPILPSGFGPRLYSSLAFRPGSLQVVSDYVPKTEALRKLQERFRKEYERLFPFIFKQHALPRMPRSALAAPPDIAIVVAESFRWEQLSPKYMPRLFEWSKKGLRAERHYSGSNHSESGLFILLYGQSPLRFNATLDRKVPPTLCELLRASEYRCGYYTGHPKVWLRREEFLNDRTVDDFVHDSEGDWNDWDRRALQASAKHLNDDKRRLSLTFLMSSHYEYRYPEKYRRHVPDDPPSTAWLPGQARRNEFASCRNRYLNVTAYLDDLITDYVESLGKNTLVFFTGDHGESTGEDGRFGHGYGFSDPLTRVPFVLVGPGIQPEVRSELTSHHDILPTVAHALGFSAPENTLGSPLQLKKGHRELLSTYTRVGRPVADALLLAGDMRLKLRLDPLRPDVEVHGFENAMGQPIDHDPTDDEVEALVVAFVDQLERAGNPVLQ